MKKTGWISLTATFLLSCGSDNPYVPPPDSGSNSTAGSGAGRKDAGGEDAGDGGTGTDSGGRSDAGPAPGGAGGLGGAGGGPSGQDAGGADAGIREDSGGAAGTLTLEFESIDIPEAYQTRLLGHRFLPNSDEFLMWNQAGHVGHFRFDDDAIEQLGSFEVNPGYTALDCGIHLAFDPNFEDNGRIYFTQCDSQEYSGVYRYVFDASDYASVTSTRTRIITEGRSGAGATHNAGAIGFDDVGNLWALFGEKYQGSNGQNRSTNLGALLRVRVNDHSTGGYLAVDDNPFATDPGASADIYAFGLRAPYFGLRDHHGFYWVADVGNDLAEEINLVTEAGQTFGWNEVEGFCDDAQHDCSRYVDPLFSWPHDFDHRFFEEDEDVASRGGRAAYVGTEYVPHPSDPYSGALDYRVLFGDMCSGFVRVARIDRRGAVLENRHVGHLLNPISWQQAPDGMLTVATYGNCQNKAGTATPMGALHRAVPKWNEVP